jgi:tetratricopeptide (TPR) repeat protein
VGTRLLAPNSTQDQTMQAELASLWNFSNPEQSEQRFLAALANATPDQALILQTQIARSFGLRRQFDRAQDILAGIQTQISSASIEAQIYYALELGRSYASAKHTNPSPDAIATARAAYLQAYALAQGHNDALAIDALHMLAFVDTAPQEQLHWAEAALAIAVSSANANAQKWQASLRNNAGYALHQLGRLDEALAQFKLALQLRLASQDAPAIRIAYWMIAWTLRSQGQLDEAINIQLRLEQECAAAGQPDPYVFEELAALYQAKGDASRAAHYSQLQHA